MNFLKSANTDINVFEKLFSGKIFWRQLWKRDISSFILPPETNVSFQEYISIYNQVKTITMYDVTKCIIYFAENGYDTLIYKLMDGLLSNEYTVIIPYVLAYAAKNGHKSMVFSVLKNQLSKSDYDFALRAAASGNQLEMMQLMLDKGLLIT